MTARLPTDPPLVQNMTKRCELCDSPLELLIHGRVAAFTAHTPEFCRKTTIERIAGLVKAIEEQRTTHLATEQERFNLANRVRELENMAYARGSSPALPPSLSAAIVGSNGRRR